MLGACEDCGFNWGSWVELMVSLGRDEATIISKGCPKCRIESNIRESVLVDDMLCVSIGSITVGQRVFATDKPNALGTIVHIALSLNPFRVKWDDGDFTDWFAGDQLEQELKHKEHKS